jgi:hypothetical protein
MPSSVDQSKSRPAARLGPAPNSSYNLAGNTQRPGYRQRASGTFLASEFLSGKRAAQGLFLGWLGVLPKTPFGGVGVQPEDVVEAFLGGVGVGEDALGAGPAFVPGGVEQDGFLDAGQVGQ